MDDKARQMAIQPGSRIRYKKMKRFAAVLGILALVIGVGAGVYFWQEANIQTLKKQKAEEVATLNSTVEALKKEIGTQAAEKNSATKEAAAATAAVKEAIVNAVNSKSYLGLKPSMVGSVRVIIAASGGTGMRSPLQAVEDLKYLNNVTGTWNFDVPAATVADWRTGDYALYVPESGAVIGLSTDGYVVIFKLNGDNKITDIFMAVNEDLM